MPKKKEGRWMKRALGAAAAIGFILWLRSLRFRIGLADGTTITIPTARQEEFDFYEPKIIELDSCFQNDPEFYDVIGESILGTDIESLTEEEQELYAKAIEEAKKKKSIAPLYYIFSFGMMNESSEDFYLFAETICTLKPSRGGQVRVYAESIGEAPNVQHTIKLGDKEFKFTSDPEETDIRFEMTEKEADEYDNLLELISELDYSVYITWNEGVTAGLMGNLIPDILDQNIKIDNEDDQEPSQDQYPLMSEIQRYREDS